MPLSEATIGPSVSAARLAREWQTMKEMVRLYCKAHHHPPERLCRDCQELLDYAARRLERCRFGPEKPTCARCPVHCYQKIQREQIRAVMRFAGPRMLPRHPILTVLHWLDAWRPTAQAGGSKP